MLGYEQTAVKGRAVKKDAVPGVAGTELPALLANCLIFKELDSRSELPGARVWGGWVCP